MRLSITVTVALLVFAGTQSMRSQTGPMRQVDILDPVLQMPAWSVNVPANWKAEGTMLPGSSCESATTPVVRASSPDGLTGFYLLPRTDWAWGAIRPQNDCQRPAGVSSARDYLIRLARIRQLEVGDELPVPELANARSSLESLNQQAQGQMHFSTDMARSLVRYSVKDQPVEEWLTVILNCNNKMVMAVGEQNECSAFVSRWFAPRGKLEARIPEFKAMKMQLNQSWMDEWTAAMVRHSTIVTRQQTAALLEQGRLAQGMRMQQHRDFMSTMEKDGVQRKDRFEQSQYRKQSNKEDYVDHILDCQRAYSGNNRVSVGNCESRETW